ncbi:hypothetical protein TREMEDRAFT_64179 [Tremella mesenterica DSM 1558]|uniref:uncharacterized protein n=1 Tax=Tremella mesenterica (strain ATCC 24925 / CBS 8224 / DSM 1558 / NBRC 9311 / NRRL Y-6157 / RJB 2259-6 / UBC 559-6) TaxID=578456 RepID=UPI0003F4A08D|nr:uncharacterized protein TREMEDRAFT_64179 [Tremella mesenterica DSM 1558]EIW67586.1 hypothetical protein TREMEDRAFT_64179 [Tremella mesenterica DSM 1558]
MSLRTIPSISSSGIVPVFHPNHPHNNRASPLKQNHPNIPLRSLGRSKMISDESDLSPSPEQLKRCFCGRQVEKESDTGMYCSRECAQRDTFSSLCYKPQNSSLTQPLTSSASISRGTSLSSSTSSTSANYQDEEYGSHYRRMARADLRREERREERRRRRAEGSVASTSSRSTMMSTSSFASSRIPDLIHSHSRNPSVASTASSIWSSNLSRNPSSASNVSSVSRGCKMQLEDAIMEDDDEEELLDGVFTQGKPQRTRILHPTKKMTVHKRRPSHGNNVKRIEPFGMGQDMLDVLEDIISMEKTFAVEEQTSSPGIFTAVFDKPPRTPSPINDKRISTIPAAPGAPGRHRGTSSMSVHMPVQQSMGLGLHQSSLSESHTALYLVTASPERQDRRSTSPKLSTRQSLTFSIDSAGPSIPTIPSISSIPISSSNSSTSSIPISSISSNSSLSNLSSRPFRKFDSPMVTPSRRNISPTGYAPIGKWRFPTPTSSDSITPTRARQRQISDPMQGEDIGPALLWPPQRDFAPSLFPTSPATGTPEFGSIEGVGAGVSIPDSGVKLGVLLGSGNMEIDEGGGSSTEHVHGNERTRGEYLPVFLEAEGFRAGPY